MTTSTSETSPQLFDLNGDGTDDVVIVVDTTPCSSILMGLSGRDGSVVWQHPIHFAAFAVRCILDVNDDGHLDCLVSGRSAGFAALDSRDGSVLWSVDPSIAFPSYNFYFPLVVGDLDGDGGPDLLNIHGGDTTYDPEQHDRSPALLVAVSGRTGAALMDPIQMPDGHESYSSPVLFTMKDSKDSSNQFVLFGSGGETVPGSLWGIQLDSLKERVKNHAHGFVEGEAPRDYIVPHETADACDRPDPESLDEMRPKFDNSLFDFSQTLKIDCPHLGSELHALWNVYDVCLYEIVHGHFKGVMLPPVMVDLTLDGVHDLVVSTYDGRTLALDGLDLSSVLWETYYPFTESYR